MATFSILFSLVLLAFLCLSGAIARGKRRA